MGLRQIIVIPEEIFTKLDKRARAIITMGYDLYDDTVYVTYPPTPELKVVIYEKDHTRHIHNAITMVEELMLADDQRKELDELRELKRSLKIIKSAIKETK